MSGWQQPILGFKNDPYNQTKLIMERYMYQDDSFERMLKQKADEYRMYPSNQTWDKIQQRVQKKNSIINFKSIGLTVVLLSAFSLYLSNSDVSPNKNSVSIVENNTNELVKPIAQTSSIKNNTSAVRKQTAPLVVTAPQINSNVVSVEPSIETPTTFSIETIKEEKNTTEIPVTTSVAEELIQESLIEKVQNSTLLSSLKPVLSIVSPEQRLPELTMEPVTETAPESPTLKTDAELNFEVDVPVITKPKDIRRVQFYITPSASYRVLYADNKFTFGNLPQQDPENEVTNKKALGFEAGAALLLPIARRITFRTGIQFNYTRYTVNAFKATPQLTTVRLNYTSIQRVTSLNNDYGTFSKDVSNETYQVSIPLGIEFKLVDRKKLQWGIATNVQPTYLVKASGYLLTNDYKKYIKAPDLLSNLNLNTALETFIRWDAKKFQLQAGPQIRYQLFSNSRGVYPVREHLVDYGFRIGIVKPLR